MITVDNNITITKVQIDGVSMDTVIIDGVQIFSTTSPDTPDTPSVTSWYVFRNNTWSTDIDEAGWKQESGGEGCGIYTYGVNNGSGTAASFSTPRIDTKGCRTLTIKLSNCNFESTGVLGVRNRSVSTDSIHTINTIGTHTITLPASCKVMQLYILLPASGGHVYIDEIQLSA